MRKKDKVKPESYWNYRLVDDKGLIEIREVYYTKGKITGYSDAVAPYGESKETLVKNLELMKRAIFKPILKIKDLKERV